MSDVSSPLGMVAHRSLAIGPMSVVAPLASLAAVVRVVVGVAGGEVVGLLDAGANALFALALTEGMISTVSVIGSLFPVTTVFLGTVLLRERPGWLPAAGIAGVLVAVGLVTAFGGA